MPDQTIDQSGFNTLFAVVATIIVVGIVASITIAIIRANRVVQAGRNPVTLQTDLELKLLDSAMLAPAGPGESAAADTTAAIESIETRLQKLDDLHARKLISDAELAAARAKILAG
ncbi:MAG: hypothetical protein JWQ39_2411 [Glaciihabitans sp.]|jgi:hypothetical protein|nr:hypothetical protein [Glaciihabitans sp.]